LTKGSLLFFGTIVAGAAASVGCKPPPMPPPVSVYVRVLDESKAPVHNAEIATQTAILSRTDQEGRAEVVVSGREGATFFVDVRCPNGYRSPGAPLEIRRLDNGSKTAPEYVAHCNRLRHKLVVNIKAVGAPASMPILHLGKPIARLDGEGKARITLEGDVLERFDLQIDTSAPAFAKIHPQNPTGSFEIANRDEERSFEVKFIAEKKVVIRRAGPSGPKAL